MGLNEIERNMRILAFQNSTEDQIETLVSQIFPSSDKKSIEETIECMLLADLNGKQTHSIVKVLENYYLSQDWKFLAKYLFVFNHRLGNRELASYYLDICADEIKENEDYNKYVRQYELTPIAKTHANHVVSNLTRHYTIDGIEKDYSIYSFSDSIGQNMTLLKTPYGAIVFDCGAKCLMNEAITISEQDYRDFFFGTETAKEDIRAVIISHAHLDHYGSLNNLIKFGINPRRVFMSKGTKELIKGAAKFDFDLNNCREVKDFFVANNSIRIASFENGHIVGSEGYLVSFDNINVVYTGDYCTHEQLTVGGLNYTSIINNPQSKKYGIDCLITESTYGDGNRQHYLKNDSSHVVIKHFVEKLLGMGYKVFFPSFAIGRSQELALLLNKDFSVLIDGLAVKVTKQYETITGIKIYNENTRYSEESNLEEKRHNFDSNNIIIASSGMITKDSTSYNYLKEFLDRDDKIAVIKTGFISSESYGNELLKTWNIKHVLLDISLSAHASYGEIIGLIENLHPRNIVSIHIPEKKNGEIGDGVTFIDNNEIVLSEELAEQVPTNILRLKENETSEVQLNGDRAVETSQPVTETTECEKVDSFDNADPNQANYCSIENPQLKSQIDNVVKTGKTIKAAGISLENSRSFCSACKLLIRFVKMDERHKEFGNQLSAINDYDRLFAVLEQCVLDGYKYQIEESKDSEDGNNDVNVEKNDTQIEVSEDSSKDSIDGKKFLSDIMIVKNDESDYYVSEKIQGGILYYELLKSRSHRSNHYLSYELAVKAANKLYQKIAANNPGCKIIDVDIMKFIDHDEETEASISCDEYFRIIDERIENIKDDDKELDFKNLGLERGYKLSRTCKKTFLYPQIEKAMELLESFEWDKELFANDILYYNGFIEAVKDAIQIQDEHPVMSQTLTLHVIDERNVATENLTCSKVFAVSRIAKGSVIVHNLASNIDYIVDSNIIYIFVSDISRKHAENIDYVHSLKEKYNIPEQCNVTYAIPKSYKKSVLDAVILKSASAFFTLDKGNDSYMIHDSLSEEDENGDKQFEDQPIEEISLDDDGSFGNRIILKSNADKYLRIITAILSESSTLKDTDISEIKDMVNRCIKHDQPDWKTVYRIIGQPPLETMKEYVDDSVALRNDLRIKRYDRLHGYKEKYFDIFTKMRDYLEKHADDVSELDKTEYSINELTLTPKVYNALNTHRLYSVKQIIELSEFDLINKYGFTKSMVNKVVAELNKIGLNIKY